MGDQQIQLIGPMTGVGLIPIALAVALGVWISWPQLSRWLRRRGWLAPQRRAPARPGQPPQRRAGRRLLLSRRAARATSEVAPPAAERPAGTTRPASAGAASERDQTRAQVAALPPSVTWPLAYARIDRLPVFYDGRHWHSLDLTASRHAVICGASRSGKGNLLQLLALTALAQGAERAAVWVIDPKGGLDWAPLMALRHARVFGDVAEGENPFDGDLSAGYRQALGELARRNRLLLAANARNHHEYRSRTGQQLPILVLICEEVADLSDSQQRALSTLARMSAAAGMVIWATIQYPTAANLPSQVQANALDRVVFQFPSSRYSAVALGLSPGERPVYEPSAIGERGVAILRQDGRDVGLGRVPLLGDAQRDRMIEALQGRYGRATPQPDVVAPAATRSTTEAATPPVAADPAGNVTDPPVGEALRSSDAERDDLVRRLAGEGASQREIRRQLVDRGLSIGQDRLVALYQEGRAALA
ncbi:MAG TPA: FtsK/SpoIIIE domain-containing protein [Roseiflexaceae bacterium]|nr:FtsK/SpoIIIE domain-containing protein [Roseiflexaceae bacterium]